MTIATLSNPKGMDTLSNESSIYLVSRISAAGILFTGQTRRE